MSDFVKVLEDELAALELAMANGTIKAKRLRELLTTEYRAMSTGGDPLKDARFPNDITAADVIASTIKEVYDVAKPDSPSSPTVSAQEARDVLVKLSHNSSRPAVQNTEKPAPVVRNGKGARMKHEIALFISKRNTPVHRADILKHLIHKKIMGDEANPINHLSTCLSRWPTDFVSDGRGNFSLRNGRLSGPPRGASKEQHHIGVAG